jgi:LmbE family N-acetylglucosaminyl deacetylase
MADKRLLLSLAHPDDESFGSGGLIARYASEGVEISYLCATKGDRGTVKPEYLEKYGSIEAVRAAELACAADKLGIAHLFQLGYNDSGMMGAFENKDPHCLWQANEMTVTGQVVEVIRKVRPQVVITFDPFGAYGHPDHIFMNRATTKAFLVADDGDFFPDKGEPYAPQKLYYTRISKSLVNLGIFQARLRAENPAEMGVNKDINMFEIRDNIPPLTTRIDVRNWLEEWDAASNCHESQGGGIAGQLPGWVRRWFFGDQTLSRHAPPVGRGEGVERDVFAGVDVSR